MARLIHQVVEVLLSGFQRGAVTWYRWHVPQGAVAQLAERLHGMQEVRGSIPLSSTYTVPGHRPGTFCLLPAGSRVGASQGAVATYE